MGAIRDRAIVIARDLASRHVAKGSQCYMDITEGRTDWSDAQGGTRRYSWCGDFVTYVLMMAGIVDGEFLNRAALRGGNWRIGENISMLLQRGRQLGVALEGPAALSYAQSRTSEAMGADVYIMQAPAGGHVGLIAVAQTPNAIWTYDGNGPGGTTGRNLRSFGATHQLAAIIPIDYWDAAGSLKSPVARSEQFEAPLAYITAAALDVARVLSADAKWATSADALNPVPTDEYFDNGQIGIEV